MNSPNERSSGRETKLCTGRQIVALRLCGLFSSSAQLRLQFISRNCLVRFSLIILYFSSSGL